MIDLNALVKRVTENRAKEGLVSVYKNDETGAEYTMSFADLESKTRTDAKHIRRGTFVK